MIDIINVTFVNNKTALNGDFVPNVVNSIFWDNENVLTNSFDGMPGTISFSILQDFDFGDYTDGGNNIDANPMLNDNYRITSSSPAVDMGNDSVADDFNLTLDIDLEQRKVNLFQLNRPEGFIDMGANEAQSDVIFKNNFE